MFKNYFKTAWRGLRNNKMYSSINITGLAASLAISILLLLWVSNELSYDRFHVNAQNIYMLAPKFDEQNVWYMSPAPIAVYAKREVPEVQDACRITENGNVSVFEYNGKQFTESHNCVADASLFSMFTFPFIEGNPQQPFTDAYSIVLSETTAKKFFSNEDPMSKVLKANDKKLYRVTGVIKDMPTNSYIH